ncbi:leucine-rich repeat domain-containing protein [Coprococcus eutactus]|uniref:Leucine-rich repeat domain-containing protein n=1 Tax=Coprococcus eutactus TaxID=33043 RepID=A0A412INB9_9FIRM|nr:leucine-rich repeat domain-containing protein [Coprococcus eutactus]
MKKIIAIIAAMAVMMSFAACGDKKDTSVDTEDTAVSTAVDTAEGEETNNDDGVSVTDSVEITVDDVKNHAETPASDFEYVDHGDSVSIKAYNGSDPIVVIPEQIDGKDVISIIDGPFSNDSFIKGISLPDTIKELSYTFCNNACLQVVLATGVETVGEGTFNCDNLRIVDLGDKVTTFNESNFFLGSMERLHIPAGVTELNKYMFMDGTEKLTIVGEAGSYAESYASEIGARFEAE